VSGNAIEDEERFLVPKTPLGMTVLGERLKPAEKGRSMLRPYTEPNTTRR